MGLKAVNDYTAAGDQRPNYSGFVVIGAGLPRTGTMSLRAALGQVKTEKINYILKVLVYLTSRFWTELVIT